MPTVTLCPYCDEAATSATTLANHLMSRHELTEREIDAALERAEEAPAGRR